MGAALRDRRNRDVDRGRDERQIRNRRASRAAGPHSHLAHGGDEPRPGRLDRRVRDFFRCFPRDVAFHVHHHRRTNRGDVASLGARVFVFSLDARHGGRNRLRPVEISLWQGRRRLGVSGIDAHGWILLAIGFVVSFIVAYGSVAWFMAWVRRHGFVPFAIYRIIAGCALLIWLSKLAS